jgi:PAS domain S-box-containing protein
LRRALDDILKGAIELLGADTGAIRILDPTRGTLKIEAHRGLTNAFLGSFREVSAAGDSPCGWALQSGERMVVADVEAGRSASLAALARSAGFRAVQSTPIMSRDGVLLGTLATHFRAVHKSSEQDLRLLDLYVRQAADIIERHRADDALRESEERLRLAQLRTGVGIWDWNLRTGKVTWTPELEALFGLRPGTVKRYADYRDRVHPEDIAAVEARREAALRRRETYTVEFRIIRPDGQVRWILAVGGALYDELTGEPIRILGNNADITDRKRAEERQQVLVAELDHRVKNVLATVSAVISHTREGNRSVANFAAALEGRIRSMATTHQLLSSRHWQGIPLTKLVHGELAPYATRDNIAFSGPEIILRPEAGQAMAIVLHELATNAAKYGALSTGTGRVSIRWHRRANGQSRSPLVLEWQEIDGPPVVAPSKSGYGTSTVRDLIPYEFGGSVDLLLDREGVRCRLELPAEWLAHDATEVSGPSVIPSAS